MDESLPNPITNRLQAGVTEEGLLAAIRLSGYGVQSVAVDKIAAASRAGMSEPFEGTLESVGWRIGVEEEWSYIDRETQVRRNLDALVSISLTDNSVLDRVSPEAPADTLYFYVDLLVECKQSDLPFAFFIRDATIGDVPRLLGAPHDEVIAHDLDGDAIFGMSLYQILGLWNLPWATLPKTAISMSKVHRKSGGTLELSGEEAFRGLSAPLFKSLDYYRETHQSRSEALYHHVRFVQPVAVLRAPMMAVTMLEDEPQIEPVPWVRLVALQPSQADSGRQKSETSTIDVVHIDYLESYTDAVMTSAIAAKNRYLDFVLPCLTGRAEADLKGLADSAASRAPDDPLFSAMRPRLSEEEFMTAWRQRSREFHQRDDQDDAPLGYLER